MDIIFRKSHIITIPEWKDFLSVPDVLYVAGGIGEDNPAPTNGVTLDRPFKTIRYACEEIEKGARNANAAFMLEQNRTFIAYETAKWAKRQIITQTSPFFIGFAFDEAKFQRLAGYALDGIVLDLKKGHNVDTRRVAQTMKDNASPDWFTTGSESQNVAALNHVISLCSDVISSATPSADYQALDGVASGDRYLQIKDATKAPEAGALGVDVCWNANRFPLNSIFPVTAAVPTKGNRSTFPITNFPLAIQRLSIFPLQL